MTTSSSDSELEFPTQADFEAWLREAPREWSIILAARAALRASPIIATERLLYYSADEHLANVTSVAFRAVAVARAAVKTPTQRIAVMAGAAAKAAADLAKATEAPPVVPAALAAANAATAASLGGLDEVAAASAEAYLQAVGAASIYCIATSSSATAIASMIAARAQDVHFLAVGGSPRALASEPLWLQGTPEWAIRAWTEQRTTLPGGEDWEVWVQWYEARLQKALWSDEKELIYINVPLEAWNSRPATANAWIRQELERLERTESHSETLPDIPQTRSAGAQFTGGRTGPIDVAADPPAHAPEREKEQRELYHEMRDLALQFASLEGNVLGDVASIASRIVVALPEQMGSASIHIIWSRVNGAREILAAHDEAMKRREGVKFPEPDPAELPLAVAARLRAFVKCYNVFIIGDAKGLELEAQGVGPEERARTEAALAAIAPVIADLSSSLDVATSKARDLLQELTEAGVKAPAGPLGDKDKAQAKETTGNFVLQLVRSCRGLLAEQPALMRKGIPEGAYREIGKRTLDEVVERGPQFVEFVHRHADSLIEYANSVWNSPAVVEIINLIHHLY